MSERPLLLLILALTALTATSSGAIMVTRPLALVTAV